jgi:hypothetical protein
LLSVSRIHLCVLAGCIGAWLQLMAAIFAFLFVM